jgi:hypothetical protein
MLLCNRTTTIYIYAYSCSYIVIKGRLDEKKELGRLGMSIQLSKYAKATRDFNKIVRLSPYFLLGL